MSFHANFLEELNPAQRAGAEALDGPVLVIAGAGSGKTKMLTARIANLICNHQTAPHNILAVTFTNKAAGEMRERVHRTLGGESDPSLAHPYFPGSFAMEMTQPHIGTFHSICTRILRRELDRTPFTKPFVIYDDSDQLEIVKVCFEKLGISDKMFSPKSIQYGINQAKCSALEPKDMPTGGYDFHAKNLAKVYELYQQELFKNNAVDFGEIITMAYRVLRDNADVLERYRKLFRYIHVDEYQDTNRAQYLLIRLLAAGHRNLCVVGDEDQSIYKWRGADIRNILDFEKDYPEAQIIKLEQNYRSTKTIISASSKLISHNTSRKDKTLWTANEAGEPILRFQVSDDRAESELVVGQLKELCASQGFAYRDVAIFYRTNAQSRVLEDVLRREKIPYRIVGGLRFYDRKEIKDVLAYFRILINGSDSVSFKRIINVPARAIGKATVDKIEEQSMQQNTTFEEMLRQSTQAEWLSSGPRRKVAEFAVLVDELRGRLDDFSLSEFYHELMDRTHYFEELRKEGTEEALSRIENLKEFDSILAEFEEGQEELSKRAGTEFNGRATELLPTFLETITLASDQDKAATLAGVNLMTVHMSKGLEFPAVFMVGMEEGLFPSGRAVNGSNGDENEDEVEEERRLCYVGMTRAKKHLVMTHAVCRRVYGNILYHEPARFFQEIPEEFVKFADTSRFRMAATRQAESFEMEDIQDSETPSNIGRRVRHRDYGVGVIRAFEGYDQNAKVTVEFNGHMTKKFIWKFANLEYVS